MQGHWDVVAQRVVVGDADEKVHDDKEKPGVEGDARRDCAATRGEDESLGTDEEELGEGDQVADAARLPQ